HSVGHVKVSWRRRFVHGYRNKFAGIGRASEAGQIELGVDIAPEWPIRIGSPDCEWLAGVVAHYSCNCPSPNDGIGRSASNRPIPALAEGQLIGNKSFDNMRQVESGHSMGRLSHIPEVLDAGVKVIEILLG